MLFISGMLAENFSSVSVMNLLLLQLNLFMIKIIYFKYILISSILVCGIYVVMRNFRMVNMLQNRRENPSRKFAPAAVCYWGE